MFRLTEENFKLTVESAEGNTLAGFGEFLIFGQKIENGESLDNKNSQESAESREQSPPAALGIA